MLDATTGYVQRRRVLGRDRRGRARRRWSRCSAPGAKQLVLDLRDAAWGAPAEGSRVAELFLQGRAGGEARGPARRRAGAEADAGARGLDRPARGAGDNGTAGPGEIVAAALLDAGRAKLVGEHTFGRAAVQKMVPLPEGGLVLTVAKYMSPKGNVDPRPGRGAHGAGGAAGRGRDARRRGARPDRILEKALEVLKAEAAAPAAKAAAVSEPAAFRRLPGEKRGQRRAGTFIAAPV